MRRRRHALMVLFVSSLALSACYVRETSGGYTAQCEVSDAGGWSATGYGSLTRTIGSHKIDLSTRHLYYATEPGTLIEVHAYSFTEHGAHDIRLSVSDIMLDLGREKVRPLEGLRENPFMHIHWHCGGKFTETSNLNVCGPAVLTFPKEISRSQAFTLHLGKLQIDGKAYDVPDIKYCYIPPTSKWVKFHG